MYLCPLVFLENHWCPFLQELIVGTKDLKWWSTNLEIFSVGVLQPDITGRPGHPSLRIFGNKQNLSVLSSP